MCLTTWTVYLCKAGCPYPVRKELRTWHCYIGMMTTVPSLTMPTLGLGWVCLRGNPVEVWRVRHVSRVCWERGCEGWEWDSGVE